MTTGVAFATYEAKELPPEVPIGLGKQIAYQPVATVAAIYVQFTTKSMPS